tara:strand:+ start:42 stop:269 length:228 start_codon:yes stop_codon:yes gene_type:complete
MLIESKIVDLIKIFFHPNYRKFDYIEAERPPFGTFLTVRYGPSREINTVFSFEIQIIEREYFKVPDYVKYYNVHE